MRVFKKRGFSLLEVIVAVGILATMTSQLLTILTNSLRVQSNTENSIFFGWVLRGLSARVEYMEDVKGYEKGFEKSTSWEEKSPHADYKVEVNIVKQKLELGQLIQVLNSTSEEPILDESMIAATKEFPPMEVVKTVELVVKWQEGRVELFSKANHMLLDFPTIEQQILGLEQALAGMTGGGSSEKNPNPQEPSTTSSQAPSTTSSSQAPSEPPSPPTP